MILLSGPRQSGKTTLAKSLLDSKGVYLNWDIREDQRMIREESWDKTSSLIIFDEIHKRPKWKNFLKGIADQYGNKPPILVTGSARLETLRKSGDALTGRFYSYTLHPIDLIEAKYFPVKLSQEQIFQRLLESGGFPEAYLQPKNAERLRNNRMDLVLQEDLRDISGTSQIRSIQLLLEILRERTGQLIQYANIAKDLSVSPATVKSWIDILEKLYCIFIVYPYTSGISRSIRKEFKVYFYDCGSAFLTSQKVENLVACSLLKQIDMERDTNGGRYGLYFFRDREKREVDFIITKNYKPFRAIEIKSGRDSLSNSLHYFCKKLSISGEQWVLHLPRSKEVSGIRITNLIPKLGDKIV
jgi:hypothetical protein